MQMNRKIKAFFFDLDSTTYDHNDDCVRPSTYEGLRKLKENGYKICLNTSRSYSELYNAPKDFLELFDALILLSGAYIVKDGETRVKKIKKDTVKKCVKYFEDNNLTFRYSTVDGGGYLNRHDEDKEALFYRLYEMVPGIKKYEDEEVIGFLFYADKEVRAKAYELLDDEMHADLRIAGEIYASGTDKGKAMVEIGKEFGFEADELCAFGDSNNDVSMFKESGLAIALGKCSDGARENADYITDDISDEGLYNALVHFGFIGD